jgi:hypothetical protein
MNKVDDKSAAVLSMTPAWEMVDVLLGGTEAMRKAGERVLPRFAAESDKQYQARRSVATLYPAYSDTVVKLAGRPFSRDISMEDADKNPEFEEWMKNVDRQGRNLDHFMSSRMENAIAYGMSHILVDFPKNDAVTVEEEKAKGIRPYFVAVNCSQLLGWRVSADGTLRQVRYAETVTEDDGEFGSKDVKQVRVYEETKWAVYRKVVNKAGNGEDWVVWEAGPNPLGVVPFVTIYGRRTAPLMSRPPMIELAFMNVKHYQSQSDQDNILHVARVPLLVASGVDSEFDLVVGSSTLTKLPPNATLMYTEHTGSAIGAGKISLDDLKEEMRQAGAQMMVVRPGPRTATEVSSEDNSNLSDLQRITENAQDSLNTALEYMAKWAKVAKAPKATLFKEFGVAAQGVDAMTPVLAAVGQGVISKETAFNEMRRRAIIDPTVTWEDEEERMEAEGPPVGETDPLTGLPYDKPAPPQPPNQGGKP